MSDAVILSQFWDAKVQFLIPDFRSDTNHAFCRMLVMKILLFANTCFYPDF